MRPLGAMERALEDVEEFYEQDTEELMEMLMSGSGDEVTDGIDGELMKIVLNWAVPLSVSRVILR